MNLDKPRSNPTEIVEQELEISGHGLVKSMCPDETKNLVLKIVTKNASPGSELELALKKNSQLSKHERELIATATLHALLLYESQIYLESNGNATQVVLKSIDTLKEFVKNAGKISEDSVINDIVNNESDKSQMGPIEYIDLWHKVITVHENLIYSFAKTLKEKKQLTQLFAQIEVFSELTDKITFQEQNLKRIQNLLTSKNGDKLFSLDLSTLVELAVSSELDSENDTISNEYSLFLTIEEKPWWPEVASSLSHTHPDYLNKWNRDKQLALDTAVKQSIGRKKGLGRIYDFLYLDSLTYHAGENELSKVLRKIRKLNQRHKTDRHSPEFKILTQLEELLKHAETIEYQDNVQVSKTKNSINSLKSQSTTAILLDTTISDTQKIMEWYERMHAQKAILPQDVTDIYNRIVDVSEGEDRNTDLKRDLKLLSLMYLASILLPPIKTELNDKFDEFKDSAKNNFHDTLLDTISFLDSDPTGIKIMDQFENQLLFLLTSIPPEKIFGTLLSQDFNNYILTGENSPSRLLLTALDAQKFNLNEDIKQVIQTYPEEKREQLLALLEIHNPNYQTIDLLLNEAFDYYNQESELMGIKPVDVYWEPHPSFISYQQALTESIELRAENPEQVATSSPIVFAEGLLPEKLQEVRFYSAAWFGDDIYVRNLRNALYPDSAQFSTDQTVLYYSEFIDFVFRTYQSTGEQVPISKIIGFSLLKNDGNLHTALWDTTITLKLLTRNNLFTGTQYGNYANSASGLLAITMVEDSLTQGYTAYDLAQVLPEQKYWDLPIGEFGNKSLDPADLAGTMYHLLNLLSFAGEAPTSASLGGLLMDYYNGQQENGENQYSNKKMYEQLSYLFSNLGTFNTIISDLEHKHLNSAGNESDTVYSMTAVAVSIQEINTSTHPLITAVKNGAIVKFHDLNNQVMYATLSGSLFKPFILVSSNPEQIKQLLNQEVIQSTNLVSSVNQIGFSFIETSIPQDNEAPPFELTSEIAEILFRSVAISSYSDTSYLYDSSRIILDTNTPDQYFNYLAGHLSSEVKAKIFFDLYSLLPLDYFCSLVIQGNLYKELFLADELFSESDKVAIVQELLNLQDYGFLLALTEADVKETFSSYFDISGFFYKIPQSYIMEHPSILRFASPEQIDSFLTNSISQNQSLNFTQNYVAHLEEYEPYISTELLVQRLKVAQPDDWWLNLPVELYKDALSYADKVTLGLSPAYMSYDNDWFRLFSAEELVQFYTDNVGTTYPISDRDYLYSANIFGAVLDTQDKLAKVFNSGMYDVRTFLYFYNSKGWDKFYSPREIMELVNEVSPQGETFILDKPEIFASNFDQTELLNFLDQDRENIDLTRDKYFFFIYNHANGWDKVITLEEVYSHIKSAYPEEWAYLVADNFRIFETMFIHDDLDQLSKIASILLTYYFDSEKLQELWTVEELLNSIKLRYPDRWAEKIMYYPSYFIPYISHDDLRSFIMATVGNPDYLEFQRFPLIYTYDAGWNEIWTRQEISDMFKELHPDSWHADEALWLEFTSAQQ